MSRAQRVMSGVVFGLATQLVTMVTGLWLTPFLLGSLGAERYGLWLIAVQVLAYLSLLDVGVVALMPREVAYVTGRLPEREQREALLGLALEAWGIVRWQTLLVAVGVSAVWFLLPGEWELLRWPFALVLGGFVLLFPFRLYQSVLTGLQELSFLGRVQFVSWLSSTTVTIGLVIAGYGLWALACGWVTLAAVSASLCRWKVRQRVPELSVLAAVTAKSAFAFGWLRKGAWVSLAQIAQVLVMGTDLLIVGKLFGPVAAVGYACTNKLVQILQNYPLLISANSGPALSELRAQGDLKRVTQASSTMGQAQLLVSGLVVVPIIVVNEGFVRWWVGPDQYGGLGLTLVFCSVMLLRHWNSSLVYSIFAFGRDRHISLTQLGDGAVSVFAAIVLSQHLGILGVAFGPLCGVILISLPLNLRRLARDSGQPVSALVGTIWPWAWRSLLLATFGAWLARQWAPDGPWVVGLSGAAAALLYMAWQAPMVVRSPVMNYLRPAYERGLNAWRRLRSRGAASIDGS